MNQPMLFEGMSDGSEVKVLERRQKSKPTGEQLKQEGMDRAAKAKSRLLDDARQIAKVIAVDGDGTCNADQVAEALRMRQMPELGPAAGSLFSGADWEFTGKRVASTQPNNHGRELKLWKYVGKAVR